MTTNSDSVLFYTEDEILDMLLKIYNVQHYDYWHFTFEETAKLVKQKFIELIPGTENKVYPSYRLTPAGYIYAIARCPNHWEYFL